VRVTEGGDGLRLALEPGAALWVGADVRWEDFDGDGAVQAGGVGLVDLPMPPAPMAAWISYGPRRAPLERGMGCRTDCSTGGNPWRWQERHTPFPSR